MALARRSVTAESSLFHGRRRKEDGRGFVVRP